MMPSMALGIVWWRIEQAIDVRQFPRIMITIGNPLEKQVGQGFSTLQDTTCVEAIPRSVIGSRALPSSDNAERSSQDCPLS